MTRTKRDGPETCLAAGSGPDGNPGKGAIVPESTTDLDQLDPGRLCIRCLRPRYAWRDVPPCSCVGGPL